MTGTNQYRTVFTMFTVVLAIIAADIIFLGRETVGKTLDELTEQRPAVAMAAAAANGSRFQVLTV